MEKLRVRTCLAWLRSRSPVRSWPKPAKRPNSNTVRSRPTPRSGGSCSSFFSELLFCCSMNWWSRELENITRNCHSLHRKNDSPLPVRRPAWPHCPAPVRRPALVHRLHLHCTTQFGSAASTCLSRSSPPWLAPPRSGPPPAPPRSSPPPPSSGLLPPPALPRSVRLG